MNKNWMQGSEDEVVKELKHWEMKRSFKAGGNFRGRFHPAYSASLF